MATHLPEILVWKPIFHERQVVCDAMEGDRAKSACARSLRAAPQFPGLDQRWLVCSALRDSAPSTRSSRASSRRLRGRSCPRFPSSSSAPSGGTRRPARPRSVGPFRPSARRFAGSWSGRRNTLGGGERYLSRPRAESHVAVDLPEVPTYSCGTPTTAVRRPESGGRHAVVARRKAGPLGRRLAPVKRCLPKPPWSQRQ